MGKKCGTPNAKGAVGYLPTAHLLLDAGMAGGRRGRAGYCYQCIRRNAIYNDAYQQWADANAEDHIHPDICNGQPVIEGTR